MRIALLLVLMLSFWVTQNSAVAADFKREIIYQVFTDRFCNGDKSNDDPEISKGMFDGEHKNWNAYWGGDLAGVEEKLPYIKNLGATAIWISPTIDNVNKPSIDADGKMMAPYHAYHGRDFKRIDEHIGDATNSWKAFDSLIAAAHKLGIKVIVDMPFNHSSLYNHGEFGAFYDDGHYKGDPENDRYKYFNHQPLVSDYNDRYQVQYGTIFYLGDFDQEHEFIDRYLKEAAEKYQQHGADGTRLDAAKHTNWGWQQTLTNSLYNKSDHFVVAEWWLDGMNEPMYRDMMKFANKGGMSVFDFPLANAIRKVFAGKGPGDFASIDDVISRENQDANDPNSMITFIDNHDMPRFLSLKDDKAALKQAIALIYTSRGIPSLYYGTEQYLHDDTKGGGDPYTRVWMSSFDESSEGFKTVKALSDVRKSNPAFAYGTHTAKLAKGDVYIFERKFGDNVALVAMNKNPKDKQIISAVSSSLPQGKYKDALGGLLSGTDILTAASGIKTLELAPSSVSVWISKQRAGLQDSDASRPGNSVPQNALPLLASVRPPVVTGGTTVTVYGIDFGDERGEVFVGSERMDVSSWARDRVSFVAPHMLTGEQMVRLVTQDGAKSNQLKLTIVESRLVPIRIVIEKPLLKADGEQVFITGDCVTLGQGKSSWTDAAGPMLFSQEDKKYILCVPLPAGKTVKYKLIVLDKRGRFVREESAFHSYAVPESGTWRPEIEWNQ